nr:hypothetical protein [Tanacetum cinerariifolium]
MIFDGMLRNLDNVSRKFLMYSRFIQTFLDKQPDGLPTHKEKYDVSFHTKNVFANMKRIDETVHKDGGDSLVRATTTASSLEAEQDSGNIDKTQTKATSNEPSSQGTSLGDGLRPQDTMRDTSGHTSAADTIVTTAPTITTESTKTNVEVTLASKRKGVMIQEPEETTTTKTASSQQP